MPDFDDPLPRRPRRPRPGPGPAPGARVELGPMEGLGTDPIPSLIPGLDEAPTDVLPPLPRPPALPPPGGSARPVRGWRRSMLPHAAVCAAVFTLCLLLAGGGIVGYLYEKYDHQLHRVAVLQPSDPSIRYASRQQDAWNFLVIGSDSRAKLHGAHFGSAPGARSDTTMIVHLSPDRRHVTVISIPRDSWVPLPACDAADGTTSPAHSGMFNSAFAEGGPKCTIKTVQKLTGIEITHFVEIDFSGFESMVQALGSVTVCSPKDVYDPNSGLRLHAGNNKLDGAQALAYVRARETLGDGSDLGRIKRQQMFLGDVLRQALSGSILTNPSRLTSFLDAATKAITIDTDTTFSDLRTLATSLRGLNPKRVAFYTAPIANPDYSPPGTSMTGRVLLDAAKGRALYDSVIRDRKPVTVTVVDGKTELAQAAGQQRTAPEAVASAGPTTTAAGTSAASPKLPAPNLTGAQHTCSL